MLLALQAPDHTTTASTATARTTTGLRRRRSRGVAVTSDVAHVAHVVDATVVELRPGGAAFARWTATVGQRIDADGLDAVTREITDLVAVARLLGVATVAAEVLADPTEPEPARHRAFAHVVSALVATSEPMPIAG